MICSITKRHKLEILACLCAAHPGPQTLAALRQRSWFSILPNTLYDFPIHYRRAWLVGRQSHLPRWRATAAVR